MTEEKKRRGSAAEQKTTTFRDVYEALSAIDVKSRLETKTSADGKSLTYLSWAWAVDIVTRFDPEWTYRIIEFDANGVEVSEGHGYQFQRTLSGYLVWTEVTISGFTKRMWLPIMDSSNYAMHKDGYRVGAHFVPPADAMALNKTIMRCLVKTIAMFGLGLTVFAGEDLPEKQEDTHNAADKPTITVKQPEEDPDDILDRYGITDPDDIEPAEQEVPPVAYDISDMNAAVKMMEEIANAPVGKPSAENTKPAMDSKLSAALDYKINIDRKGLKGRSMRDLIEQSKSRAKSMKVLTSLAEMDSSYPEARAARLIIDGIKSGVLSFSKEAESAVEPHNQFAENDLVNAL